MSNNNVVHLGCMRYKGGYKYILEEDEAFQTSIFDSSFAMERLRLNDEGLLVVRKGYAWDGASGPALDTPSFMRPSLGHDAMYQAMRRGFLPRKYRPAVDADMLKWCREERISPHTGKPLRMGWIRAKYSYYAVRLFAGKSAMGASSRKVLCA